MKFFLFIFSIYFLALSVMPCTDACGMNTNNTFKKDFIQRGNNHQSDNSSSCSPFCNCSCCRVNITSYSFKPFEIKQPKPTFIDKIIALRDFTLISFYSGSIWHPPKFTV
ncbi:DUF6660 family protein [Pedobacter antarcticus]|uniref:DUF6660 family protein n=1 Tax=Pedobacter antarcticus TaxID=34086 RepID=UPI003CC7CF2A